MIKPLSNWTYHKVTTFIKEHDFSFYESEGNLQVWIKLKEDGEPDRFVQIRFTNGVYNPKALMKMIRESGIPEDVWIKRASE